MKIFNIVLIVFLLVLPKQFSSAQDFNVKSFKYYGSSNGNKGRILKYKPAELYITKKDYKLCSSMQKDFIVRKYTITNISSDPIILKLDNGVSDVEKIDDAVKYVKNKRKQNQSKTAFLIPLQDGYNDAGEMIGANNGILFFAGISSVVYNFCIKFPLYIVKSAYNTIAAPMYYFQNNKDDKLIENDIRYMKLKNTKTLIDYTLPTNDSVQIINLFPIATYPYIKAKLPNEQIYQFAIK